jgi:elongation factor 3
VQASLADLNVVDFVFADPLLHSSGLDVSREEIVTQLTSVGFTQEMLEMVITSLSGGWKMKLALARAMLMKVSEHRDGQSMECFRCFWPVNLDTQPVRAE